MRAVLSIPYLRFAAALVLAAAALASAARPLAAGELRTFSGDTMGTSYTVRIVAPADLDADELHAAIDERLERVNDQMSTWRPDSELSRFNRHPGTDWFDVSPETAEVVAAAIRIGEATGGAFDVTVGPLVNLWQFGPDAPPHPPTGEQLAAALQTVGYRQLAARLDPPALRKNRPDLYVDLSGIAKGFGVDDVARLLDERGVEAYLVEIGGEVRARGRKPDGTGWRVGIEAPLVERRALQRTVELSGKSLATSGDYRNFHEVDGHRLSHTIDPRTGRPVAHALVSATVIAESCMDADALATALMVLGPDDAYEWAAEHDLAALLIVQEGTRLIERPTPRFAALFPVQAARPAGLPTMFLLTLIVFALAFAAMAVGVLLGKRRLRGTCGGLANLQDPSGRPLCEACHDPSPTCTGVEDARRRAAGTREE